jgi:predicted TIM-barrel fold metal-dependent hydrolase
MTDHSDDEGDRAEPPLVDSHTHIFPRDVPLTATAWTRPDYGFTVEEYVAAMDASGVHFGVIAAMSLTGDYNDYVIDAVRATPRLRGTVNVTPAVRRSELREMADAGIVGLRLFRSARSFGDPVDLTTDEYRVLFRRVRDLGWHVHVVCDPALLGETLDVLNAAGVDIVVDHFGNPDLDLVEACPTLDAAVRSVDAGRTWIKISGGFRLTTATAPRPPEAYAEARERERRLDTYLLGRVGTDRLIWGTDAPFVGHEGTVTYQDVVDSYTRAIPSAATRRAIDRTALGLFFS